DQPFNASVIARLGIGLRLWKRRASAGAIARAVRALLDDDRFHRRAQGIAGELRDGGAPGGGYAPDHPPLGGVGVAWVPRGNGCVESNGVRHRGCRPKGEGGNRENKKRVPNASF